MPSPSPDSELTVTRSALLMNGTDATFREMLHDMLSLSSSLDHVRNRFGASLGLSGVQYTLLSTIRHLQGATGVGVKELAEQLGFSSPFVTTETTKLVRLGVIEKTTNPDDLRRVNLTLTARGRDLLIQLSPMQREINDAIFEPLSRDDVAALYRVVRDLRRSAERAVVLSDHLLDGEKE